MIKQAISAAGLEVLAVGGLLMFVAVFAGVTWWVLSRSRKEIDKWSSLPLAEGVDPVDPRLPVVEKPSNPSVDALPVVGPPDEVSHRHGEGGCGKCENCQCGADSPTSVTTPTSITTLAVN
ncbi:Cbb3-type cytochrome oxidase component FixQ [Botrimarina colliarenosi]|uniref:Cbb3-type cytochrome oxidase component FixQ n=1 Tax=Botrimarina colliarenosi TaxID=2528001 RepID=A0A5C6AE16_9BACT|nr:cbb3-type cytochrome c oxidase subunit 3 [Botrimarina colliarenosi]TWT97558.1 Cbb3-type cytochrome oxidase component FixQ [Botrimarina colliarenosi]